MGIKTNAYVGQVFGALTVKEILPSQKMPRELSSGNMSLYAYTVMLKCVCRCGDEVIKKKKGLVDGNGWHCGKRECKDNRYSHDR